MAEVSVGDKVKYVPDKDAWWNKHDHKGDLVYEFVHAADFSGNKKGEVAAMHRLGKVARDPDGKLKTETGHTVDPSKPKVFWEAVILALNPDGSADLEICVTDHAGGSSGRLVTSPDRSNPLHADAAGIKHDAGKAPHTWHLPEE